jgi:hypothetical protein
MGDAADYNIERMLDRMFDRWEDDDEESPDFDRICKHCGSRWLKWRHVDRAWRLYENERDGRRLKMHVCNPPSADDFEALP